MSKSDASPLFVNKVRVLKAEELEKIVGARYSSASFGRYKGPSGPDNQSKDFG
jgi:hypothetical protein